MKKLLLIFFLFIACNGLATHNIAGDITYKYVGNSTKPNRYEITLKIYTRWVGPTSTDKCELQLHFGDGDTATVPRVNGPNINCPSAADGFIIGGCRGDTKMNIYLAIHDYPGTGNYLISVEDRNRNSGICNIPDSDNQSFFLQAELIIDPFLGNNSGPSYNQVPVLCDQVGVIRNYNPLAIDSDGDSLYYALVPPMSYGSPLLTWTFPPGSFTINNNTGTVTWNAPSMICDYVWAIQISEWRNISGNYYLVGKTMQDVNSIVNPYTGVSENSSENVSLNVFPNPSNGLINFTVETTSQDERYKLAISNSLGKIIKTIAINGNSAIINEDELSAGIYFYSLSNKNAVLNKGKFVILDGTMK